MMEDFEFPVLNTSWNFDDPTPANRAYVSGLERIFREAMEIAMDSFDENREAFKNAPGAFDIIKGLSAVSSWLTLRIVESSFDGASVAGLAPLGSALMLGKHREEISGLFRGAGLDMDD